MAEYIEREPILKFIEDGLNNPDKLKAFGHDAIEIMTEVQYAPAADFYTEEDVRNAYTDGFSEGMAQGMKKAVVHGRWENNHCTNCGTHKPYDRDGVYWATNYCPNCGAKMDAEAKT